VSRALREKKNISRSGSVMRAVLFDITRFPVAFLYRDTRSVTPMSHGHGQSVFLSHARSIASWIECGNDDEEAKMRRMEEQQTRRVEEAEVTVPPRAILFLETLRIWQRL